MQPPPMPSPSAEEVLDLAEEVQDSTVLLQQIGNNHGGR